MSINEKEVSGDRITSPRLTFPLPSLCEMSVRTCGVNP